MNEATDNSLQPMIDRDAEIQGLQDLDCTHFAESKNFTENQPTQMPELIMPRPTKKNNALKRKYHSKKIWPKIMCTILLILALISIGIMYWIKIQDVRLVTFNGEQKLMVNVSPEKFVDMYGDLSVSFKEKGYEVSYTYKDLGIQVQWTDEQEAMFENFEINLDDMYIYFNYSQQLKDIIEGLNDNRQDWVSATFIETEDDFIVTSEQKGNKVDIDAIEQYIIQNFGLTNLTVDLDDFKIPKPSDFITDVEYKNEVFKWSSFYVLYTSGFQITATDIKPFFTLTEDYKIIFNQEKKEALSEQVWKWINEDLDSYNTLGGTHRFLTHDGQPVELKGVNYGDKINEKKEHNFLMEVIENL